MTQSMRTDPGIESHLFQIFFEQSADTTTRQSSAMLIQKQRTSLKKGLPRLKPDLNRFHSRRSQQGQSLLTSFSANRDQSLDQIDFADVKPRQLTNM